jgi:hypothetical protein
VANGKDYLADITECDSILSLLDSANIWLKYTKPKLAHHTNNEIRKITRLHQKVLRHNMVHLRKSTRQKGNIIRTVNKHRSQQNQARVLKKNLGNIQRNVDKTNNKVAVSSNDKTPIEKYLKQIDKIERQRDSIQTLIGTMQHFRDTLELKQKNSANAVQMNLAQRIKLKQSQAIARWWMDYRLDSVLAQNEKQYIELEKSCDSTSLEMLSRLQLSQKQLRNIQNIGRQIIRLYSEERTLLHKCKNLSPSGNWDDQLATIKTNWTATLSALEQLADDYIDIHKQLYLWIKPSKDLFSKEHSAIKSETTQSAFAAKNYSGYERYRLNLYKSDYRNLDRSQKGQKKWVTNHKKDTEKKIRELEREARKK